MSMSRLLRFITLAWCLYMTTNKSIKVKASHHVFPELQSLSVAEVDHLLQPKFHFRPPRNWINDPNGPMYYKGIYHLFYQYNPKGSVFGDNNIVWGHSTSMDMIRWRSLKPALSPSKPFDIYGCWSGSATILRGNKPILLYTGVDTKQRQVQNFAIPANLSDPYLQDWIKPDSNPLVVSGSDINATQFRDPTTAWLGQDGHYRMLVGSRRNDRGMAYLYRSRDFMKWIKAKHPLHSRANSGMWECPDFYPVPLEGKHGLDVSAYGGSMKYVLKISLDLTRYDYYTIGTYDKKMDRYVPDKALEDGFRGLRYDYGNFYASKTFFDSRTNRRILWGWVNESDTAVDDVAKGWAGLQSLPRSVWLDDKGMQLLQWPIKELENLRGDKVQVKHKKLKMGKHVEIKGITSSQADVEVTFLLPSLEKAEPFDPSYAHDAQKLCGKKGSKVQGHVGPFGLLTLASETLEEYTPVFFRIFKAPNKHVVLMCSDARSSSLKKNGLYRPSFAGFVDADLADGKLSLRTLIDHSVVESFGAGGKTCITSRVYPRLAVNKNAHLFVFNNGSEAVTVQKLNAWSMNNANVD